MLFLERALRATHWAPAGDQVLAGTVLATSGLQSPGATSSGPWQPDRHVGFFLRHHRDLQNVCLLPSYEGKAAIDESYSPHLDVA